MSARVAGLEVLSDVLRGTIWQPVVEQQLQLSHVATDLVGDHR
jgi:hypothetical protein